LVYTIEMIVNDTKPKDIDNESNESESMDEKIFHTTIYREVEKYDSFYSMGGIWRPSKEAEPIIDIPDFCIIE